MLSDCKLWIEEKFKDHWLYLLADEFWDILVGAALKYTIRIHRGYSYFGINMTFISSSKAKNFFFMSGQAMNEIYIYCFMRWNKWHIHSKNLLFLCIRCNFDNIFFSYDVTILYPWWHCLICLSSKTETAGAKVKQMIIFQQSRKILLPKWSLQNKYPHFVFLSTCKKAT